ncbi:MAG: SPFH domain-containing protein [Planctomycetota bacterium]
MSPDPSNDPSSQPGADPAREVPGASRRPSSVTLRDAGTGADDAALIDRANRSALDALRIAYSLLSWTMLGLIVLFLLSGFQSVDESERAIRLQFGAIVDQDLGAGFQFAFPAPIGELVKVPFGQDDLRIDDAFYPELSERQRTQRVEQFAGLFRDSYEPERDGSLLTADLNLAHLQALVQFRRSEPSLRETNVGERIEEELIRVTVERAIVQAVSEVPVDDVVKLTPGADGSISAAAARIAQTSLDRIDAGIEILRIDINNPGPPLSLSDEFAAVTSATAKANEARDRAEQEARTRLNRIAGAAADDLIDLIDRYERASDLDDAVAAAGLLNTINAVMMGEEAQYDPSWGSIEPVPAGQDPIRIAAGEVSGGITVDIGDADTYQRSARDRALSDVASFNAKLPQFQTNPSVLVVDEWTSAMEAFLANPTVQAFFMPRGAEDSIDLFLNRDPQILRELERERNRRELERANNRREAQIRQEQLELRDADTVGVE